MDDTGKMTLDDLIAEFYAQEIPAQTAAQEWFWRNRCTAAMDAAWKDFCAKNKCVPDITDLHNHPVMHREYMQHVIDALRPIRAEMMASAQ